MIILIAHYIGLSTDASSSEWKNDPESNKLIAHYIGLSTIR